MDSPDDDKVIVSACESLPYGISTDVQRQDRFWIKSQPYSLEDIAAIPQTHDLDAPLVRVRSKLAAANPTT